MTNTIYLWNQISQMQWNSLLLGNGASIALWPDFEYKSLHQIATSKGTLQTAGPLFTLLGTTDFEHVLLACWHAYLVNSVIPPLSPNITQVYQEVREALIGAVHQVHPDPANIATDLQLIGSFASRFATVLTFNYDITLYWAMQEFNNANGQWFKDAFINGEFDLNWQVYRNRYGNAAGATLVFYAHGSLALVRDAYGVETKLTAFHLAPGTQSPLLNTIMNSWRAGTHLPLFVSEGTSREKMASIRRSPYLSTVYDQVLVALGDNIVVYGLSFSSNDQHILNAIKRNAPRQMAISVYGRMPGNEQQAYCYRVMAEMRSHMPSTQVLFFNSTSTGCWNNP